VLEIASGVYCLEVGKGITAIQRVLRAVRQSWVLIDTASANCGETIQRTAMSLFGAKHVARSRFC